MSEPLRQLTKKDQPFQWLPQHEWSFNQIKVLLTSTKVMAYFDPKKETELITDTSPTGLSAIFIVDSNDDDDLNSPADQVTLPPVPPVALLVPPAAPRRSG